MNSISKKILIAASALAFGSSAVAAPAMAWGWNGYENPYGGGYYGNPYGGGFGNPYYGGGYGGYRGYNRGRRVLKTTLIGAGIGAAVGLGYGLLTRPHYHRHRYWE